MKQYVALFEKFEEISKAFKSTANEGIKKDKMFTKKAKVKDNGIIGKPRKTDNLEEPKPKISTKNADPANTPK